MESLGKDIISIVKEVDYAFIDATFSEADELINRKMAEVPIHLSLKLCNSLPMKHQKQKLK